MWVIDGHRYPIGGANRRGRAPHRGMARARDRLRRDATGRARRRIGVSPTWTASACGRRSTSRRSRSGSPGSSFSAMADREAGLVAMRAYNDWMFEDWCSPYPDRLIPCQIPWLADPTVAAREIRRNADRGFKAVTLLGEPGRARLPEHLHRALGRVPRARARRPRRSSTCTSDSSGSVTVTSADAPIAVAVAAVPAQRRSGACRLGLLQGPAPVSRAQDHPVGSGRVVGADGDRTDPPGASAA